MFYRARLQAAAALASLSLLAGCGLLSDNGSEAEQKIVVGTTSEPSTLDPAAAWDNSWELMRNVFQTLVSFPTGSTSPEPDAADSCMFTDRTSTAYRCTLKKGLKFSNGDKLDAEAVKYSIDRITTIKVKGGPLGLLGSLDRVETKGDDTVIFHLTRPDATFPFILATPAMSLVAPSDYPKDKIREDGKVTGSGPYLLDSYVPGDLAELVKNQGYKGFANRKNNAVTIRYFKRSAPMVDALKKNEIDATYRGLTAEEVVNLEDNKDENSNLQLIETVGADIRFLVFNPEDPAAGNPAVRRAVAARRPGRARCQGLPGHRRATVLHDPQGYRRPHHQLLRQLRQPEQGEGQADPGQGGHHRARRDDVLVRHRPVRLVDGTRVR